MLSVLEMVFGVSESLNFLAKFLAGVFSALRYLFSVSYRVRVHARWRHCSQLRITADIIGSVFSIAATLIFVGLTIYSYLESTTISSHPR